MSDRFEFDLRDHLHREAAQAKDLPPGLPGRIRRTIDSGGRFTLIQQLALAGAMLVFVAAVGFLLVQLKGARLPQPAHSGFACINRSGGNPNATSSLRIVRVTPEGGFDRVTFEFDGPLPGYQVEQADSLATDRGGFVRVHLQHVGSPAAGIVMSGTPAPRVIRGVSELPAGGQTAMFGIDLSSQLCNRVSLLQNPTRLVVDFAVPPAFTCSGVQGGEQSGGPYELTGISVEPRGNVQTGFYDHLVLAFDSAVPIYGVIPQSSATFSRYDGSSVTLLGSSGIRLKLGNVRNSDLSKIAWSMASTQPSPAKTSPTDFTPNLPVIKEVALLDNSQGTIQFGIGLGSAACFRLTDQGKNLVIDFQAPAPVAQVPFQVRQLSFGDALHGWALGTASKGQVTYLIMARTTDGGATWTYLEHSPVGGSTTAAGDRWGIHFDSSQDGWLYGPSTYVTHDGGNTWTQTDLLSQTVAMAGSGSSAWAAVQSNCAQPLCPLRLEVSTDGQRWSAPSNQPAIVGPEAQIVRLSVLYGFVLSWQRGPSAGSLSVTHDGGTTWQTVTQPCTFDDRMAARSDGTVWVVCGGEPGAGQQRKQIMMSADGGAHWTALADPPSSGYVGQLALSSAATAWLATTRGPLYETHDGGRTWSATAGVVGDQVGGAGSGAIDVSFSDANHGWAATSDQIFRTTDGGQHWMSVPAMALEKTG